jgi:hypothetical protein
MWQKMTEFGHVVWMGMPVYVWTLLAAVGITNEVIERMKWTKAGSILQGIFRFVLNFPALGPLLAKFPYVGDFLRWLAKKQPDEAPPAPPAAPPAALLFPFLLIFTASCTPAQTAAWKTAGVDALRCAGTSVFNAAGDALVELMDSLNNSTVGSLDAASLGKALATKYGVDAAVCALGKAAADLLPAAGLHAAPTPRAKLIQAMLDSQKEWAK